MKKRTICLFLALAMLFSLALPALAYSSFQDYLNGTGRMKCVDYGRIKQDTRKLVKVSFELGSQTFRGTLRKGYRLDDQTTDKLIRQAMLELGLNEAAVTVHNVRIQQAAELDPAFKVDFWIEMIGQFVGLGDAVAAVQMRNGKLSGTDYILGKVQDEIISTGVDIYAGAAALGRVGSFVLSGLANCAKPAAQEAYKWLSNREKEQQAIESAAILDLFYKLCNQRLQEEADRHDDTSWTLTSNGRVSEERILFGAPVMQKWSFRCDLKKEDKTDDYTGWYSGPMFIDITHDMTKFDSRFLWDVVNNLPILPEIHKTCPWESFYDCRRESSILEKHFMCKKLMVFIKADTQNVSDGDIMDTIYLDQQFQEKHEFWMMHPIWIVPQGVMPNIDEKGRYSFPYTEGQMATTVYLMGEMVDGLSPRIDVYTSDMASWIEVKAPHVYKKYDNSQYNGGGTLITNTDLFRDLQSGRIDVKYGWGD